MFNINPENWELCVNGPEDDAIHGENAGHPWFGIRENGRGDPDELETGDLLLIRRTSGRKPFGVMGIWEFHSSKPVNSQDEVPWEDAEYAYVLYCRALQREFDEVYTENFDELSFSPPHIRAAILNLRPEFKREYLNSLLDHEPLAGDARHRIEQELEEEPGQTREDRISRRLKPVQSLTVWIEKTQIEGREYKQSGDLALGNAVFSPQQSAGGQDIYSSLREAEVGDIVLHILQDHRQFVGASIIDSELITEFSGPPPEAGGDHWTDQQREQGGYLRKLTDYTEFDTPILIYEDVLDHPAYQERLAKVRDTHTGLFYDRNHELAQGSYFTRCPDAITEFFVDESPELASFLRSHDWQGDALDHDGDTLIPAGSYDTVAAATTDIRRRRSIARDQTREWLSIYLIDTAVEDWTAALSGVEPNSTLTPTAAARCQQLVQLFMDHEATFAEQADRFGIGTLNQLSPGETLFVALFRDLQKRAGVKPNLNQVKFLTLKEGNYTVEAGHAETASRDEFGESAELEPVTEPPQRADEIARQLDIAQQLVFHGPPGTGKTYVAQQFARWWLTKETAGTPTKEQLELVTFHPSFSYEDFIEGLTTKVTETGAVAYDYKDGVFKRVCQRATNAYYAAEDPEKALSYILIIDEINRGNLAQIFGETITLLEADKRLDAKHETTATLAHSGKPFIVPPNLYVIGTMNTADRSIALVDAALRRRFRFMACPPDLDVLYRKHEFTGPAEVERIAQNGESAHKSLLALSILGLQDLNQTIIDMPDLGKRKQIGHSYLLGVSSTDALVDAWRFEILPLLEEYYFSQFSRIEEELFRGSGGGLFDQDQQQIADFGANELATSLGQLVGVEPSPVLTQPPLEGE